MVKNKEKIGKVFSFIFGVFLGVMGLSGIIFVLTQGIENLNLGNLFILGLSALVFAESIFLIKESLE